MGWQEMHSRLRRIQCKGRLGRLWHPERDCHCGESSGFRRIMTVLKSNSPGLQRTPPPGLWTHGQWVKAITLDVNYLLHPDTSSSPTFPALPKSSHLLLLVHSNNKGSGRKLSTYTHVRSLKAERTLGMVNS